MHPSITLYKFHFYALFASETRVSGVRSEVPSTYRNTIFLCFRLMLVYCCCFHCFKHSDLTSNDVNCICNLVHMLGANHCFSLLVTLAFVCLREHYERQIIPTVRNLVGHFKPARTKLGRI
ncbi:hypothetical protein GLYMA_17G262600v4 [Glycine max]|uniref:Uncharacterized protein n=1 Tax=Glycine max TaxID=3847 RepID=A0A0R0FU10_SOYBN|nr:hypothetical protein GLYMA_17G262600v4 [Glycine max]